MKLLTDWERLSDDSHQLWILGRKLEALGAILERQDQGSDGFTELVGLGLILSDASTELDRIASGIEEVRLHLSAQKDAGKTDD